MADSDEGLRGTFADPPAEEFGNTPFWWWDGDHLDEERITDQLETLAERGVESVCFEQKYPDGSPAGRRASYFSEEWWTYMEHAAQECARLGMELWIHDETYHHSPPSWKRYWQDRAEEAAGETPELRGRVVDRIATDVESGEAATLAVPEGFEVLDAAAYPRNENGSVDTDAGVALDVDPDGVSWTAPDNGGAYNVSVVGTRPEGLNRTTSDVVEWIVDHHYGEYVERLGDLLGESVAGTFQDELYVLQGTVPCDDRLLARYEAEWGEDPADDLVALFEDCGEGTGAFRARYYDVVTTMLEENWFRPLYEWHERRGLQFAHDNWGRNNLTRHATEYGDYVRTMRWFQVPGYDDGGSFEGVGTRNFFDGKLAASIAACYGRERVWGEMFHTTGWGFPPDRQLAGIAENACYGLDKYNMHGLYYATLGGWYEHAPPDAHFRQPYWEHAEAFNAAVARLMYLFSRGDPVVDLAAFYPISSVQAHRLLTGTAGVDVPDGDDPPDFEPEGHEIDVDTRELTEELYDDVADLLFVDHETLADADAANGDLTFAGVDAPVFVLGPVTTVRRDVLDAAIDHVEAGGVVVSLGGLPEETVEGGPRDPALDAALDRVFGADHAADARGTEVVERDGYRVVEHDSGGVGVRSPEPSADGLRDVLADYVDFDVNAPEGIYSAHRRVGDRELYLLLNTDDEARTAEIDLRAVGSVERWDVLEGATDSVHAFEEDGTHTTLELDFVPHEFHVVAVDTSEDSGARVTDTTLAEVREIERDDEWVVVSGTAVGDGDTARVEVSTGDETYAGEAAAGDAPAPVSLDGSWTFELDPVLDNEWGDFRYPPSDELMGPEVREFERLGDGEADDDWTAPDGGGDGAETVRPTYGPRLWRRHAASSDLSSVTTPDSDPEGWEPVVFSEREGTPGTHHDDHGLSGTVSDDFLVAPAGETPVHFWTAVRSEERATVACHYGDGVRDLHVDGSQVPLDGGPGTVEVDLSGGATPVHLLVAPDTETHLAFEPLPAAAPGRDMDYTPRLRWFHGDALHFDYRPWEGPSTERFRFELPAGATAFTVPTVGDADVWVDGDPAAIEDGRVAVEAAAEPRPVAVAADAPGGDYAGAVWTGPVAVETEPVTVDAGDWRDLGLDAYSGVGVYRTTVTVPEHGADDRVTLGLGDVAVSASVAVDGEHAGTTFSRPHAVDVTDAVSEGECELVVRVANTVANHYDTEVPTRYVYDGQAESGLLGPVELRVERGVTVRAER